MILEATTKNIEWLVERLYEVRRYMQAEGIENPTFVLLTKGEEDRHRIERIFFLYFQSRYGIPSFECIQVAETSRSHSRYELPNIGASIILMDI